MPYIAADESSLQLQRASRDACREHQCITTEARPDIAAGSPDPQQPGHRASTCLTLCCPFSIFVVQVILVFSKPFWPLDFFDIVCTDCFIPEFWVTTYPTAVQQGAARDQKGSLPCTASSQRPGSLLQQGGGAEGQQSEQSGCADAESGADSADPPHQQQGQASASGGPPGSSDQASCPALLLQRCIPTAAIMLPCWAAVLLAHDAHALAACP